MAEFNERQTSSHAHQSNVLNYGHFGTATYRPEERDWHFLRLQENPEHGEDDRSDLQERSGVEVLEGPTIHQLSVSNQEVVELAEEAVTRMLPVNTLLRKLPDLCAAAETRSWDVDDILQFRTGSLSAPNMSRIAFGGALVLGDDDLQSGHTLAPIMVSVHGPACDKLVFSRLDRTTVSRITNSGSRIEVEIPRITYNDASIWSARGTIELVTVSSRASSHSFSRFAVITQIGTSIFRPQLRKSDTANPMDSNHIVDITIMSTGCQDHADVAFHPQLSDVIAVVDIEGNWSSWKVTGKSLHSIRRKQHARLLASGYLPKDSKDTLDDNIVPVDAGRHRICWLSSKGNIIDRIAVCKQRSLYLFDLTGAMLGSVDLSPRRGFEPGLVMDMVASSGQSQDCFVLTSSHLLWLSTSRAELAKSQSRQDLSIIVSWNHFRGRTDSSLSMHILERNRETRIILYSQTTNILTIYKALRSHHGDISISEPSLISMPFQPSPQMGRLLFKTVEARERNQSARSDEIWLVKALSQRSDGTIEDCTLYLYGDAADHKNSEPVEWIALPKPQSHYHQSARFLDSDEDEDFIIDDIGANIDDSLNMLRDDSVPDLDSQTKLLRTNSTQCDLNPTYNSIMESILAPSTDDTQGIEQFRDAIEDLLEQRNPAFLSSLLSELPIDMPYIAEIEDDSAMLSSFLGDINHDRPEIRQPDARRFDLKVLDPQALMDIYEGLVQRWLLPLSSTIPNRTRIFRERLTRQIAFELWLSNVSIRRSDIVSDSATQNESHSVNALEDSGQLPSSLDHAFGTQEFASSSLNTEAGTLYSTELFRLSSLVSFTQPMQKRPVSDPFEEILAHLPTSMDEDPGAYDHNSVETEFAARQAEKRHSQLDNRTRRKAEKLNRSRQRQFDKQEQAKKVTFDGRSVVPVVASSQLPYRGVQSSQIGPLYSSQPDTQSTSAINMSQPERGTFGGRITSKKMKKGKGERRAGF